MTNIVIGTAGHIDHGKSTLIKTLTGIETDKTKEEKRRGMSINLGFAYLDLPNGQRVGIVDVPGHEKFIKNMLAGVTGLDLVLLVIDANEGIMPQTREHIDILTLLGIKDFLIVLTKVDSVEEELLEIVKEDIASQLADTPLAQSPLILVDSLSGTGITDLTTEITMLCDQYTPQNASGSPRLNIDRAFSLKGFGTIVTGTLLEGAISTGDELMIYPEKIKARVRSIQVHEEEVTNVQPGTRTAINLTNISLADVSRGRVLTFEDNVTVTWMINVKLTLLKHSNHELKLWDRVRIGIGTHETFARVVPLGTDKISPGEEGFVQLRLEEKIVARDGDHFIIRSYSPVHTIGGGVILDCQPTKNKRYDEAVLKSLSIKEEGTLSDILLELMDKQGVRLTSSEFMATTLGKNERDTLLLINELLDNGQIKKINQTFISQNQYKEMAKTITTYLDKYHKTFRLRKGMPKEELKSRCHFEMKGRDFDTLIDRLSDDHVIKTTQDTISIYDFRVTYNKYNQAHREAIEQQLLKAKFTPPTDETLTKGDEQIQEVINALEGVSVVRLDHTTVIHKHFFDEAVAKVQAYIKENGAMTLADFRDMTGSSRKYSMLILECMDKHLITKRVENTRELCDATD